MKMSELTEELKNAGVQNWVAIADQMQRLPIGPRYITLLARLPVGAVKGIDSLAIDCYRNDEDDFKITDHNGKKLFRTVTQKFLDAADGLD